MRAALLLALAGCLSTPSRPLAGDAREADAAVDTTAPPFTTRHWVHPVYTPGPSVANPSLAYDSDHHEVLRYGGETIFGDPNDASLQRLTSTGWETICDPCTPGPRSATSFAYDPVRHVAVLAGGYTAGSTFADRFFYEWNGASWTKTATQLPTVRSAAQLVFDPGRGKLVFTGGFDGTGGKSDAFTYDGSLAALPSLGGSYAADNGGSTSTYDVVNKRVLLQTGYGFASATGGDDVIGLGQFATAWSTVCSSCGAPRLMPGMIFDPVLGRTILVGGRMMGGPDIDGTWALSASAQWTQIDTAPPARVNPALVYDASRDTIVMYGGYGGNASCGGNGDCNDTWEMVPN